MNKEEFLKSGLLEQYTLQLTNAKESRLVEEMLKTYPELKRELNAMHQAVERYARSQDILPPGKKNILSDTPLHRRNNKSAIPKPWNKRLFFLVNLASLIFLSALFLPLWIQNNGLRKELGTLQQQLISCEEYSEQYVNQNIAILTDPTTRSIILQGTRLTPSAQAVVYWNPEKESACLHIIHLPSPPKGKQYQLWADVGGSMINMGVINHKSNPVFQFVRFVANSESFNITLESEGGNPHPTVDLLQASGYLFTSTSESGT